MYTKEVMEHFMNPRNVGEIKDADGVGEAGNVRCGDLMWIYLKVGKDKDGREIVDDIKFKTLGCAAAIATSSKATELAKGKTVEEVIGITNANIAESLGGLPPVKMHCSVLASDAIKEAVYDYLKKNNRRIPEALESDHERISADRTAAEEKHAC
ncbi:MAG: iron-sulfur cluster assembly scaffold protein [Candidatus Altiarchaeota archaeon]